MKGFNLNIVENGPECEREEWSTPSLLATCIFFGEEDPAITRWKDPPPPSQLWHDTPGASECWGSDEEAAWSYRDIVQMFGEDA